jgi:O-antigen/teichoic acid export membrane protein
VLNIALNLALIVRYGVLGAAMATSLSLLLFNAVRVYQVFRLVRVQPDWGEVLRVTLAAAAALLPSLAILSIGFDGRIWLTALAGMLYLLTYPLALYAFGFREDVRAGLSAVRAWAARRRARRVPA